MIVNQAARKRIEKAGACTPDDWHLMVAEKQPKQDQARALCYACPVQNECLNEFFFEAGVTVGGTTWQERKKMIQAGDVPPIPADRLVESYTKGGIRALMINANLNEPEALAVAKTLR